MKQKNRPQDSRSYTGRIGTGLTGMRRHETTATSYCHTCKGWDCYFRGKYIPQYGGRIWTWAERYAQYMR